MLKNFVKKTLKYVALVTAVAAALAAPVVWLYYAGYWVWAWTVLTAEGVTGYVVAKWLFVRWLEKRREAQFEEARKAAQAAQKRRETVGKMVENVREMLVEAALVGNRREVKRLRKVLQVLERGV